MSGGGRKAGFPPEIASSDCARRLRLAALPLEDKLLLVIRMQQLAADIARSTGRPVRQAWPEEMLR